MKFDELKLMVAIHNAGAGWGDLPTSEKRFDFSRRVAEEYATITGDVFFPFTIDDVVSVMLRLRKRTSNRKKAEVALRHGWSCFWSGRGKGPCTDEAEVGHLVPNSQGGELSTDNCVIECLGHNRQRGAMTIEQYIQSDRILVP